jgi:hypothetical protein
MAIVILRNTPVPVEELEYSTDGREIRFYREGPRRGTDHLRKPVTIRFSIGGDRLLGRFLLTSIVPRDNGNVYTYARVGPVVASTKRFGGRRSPGNLGAR